MNKSTMNVLFLCPKFFNYENEAAEAMRRIGANVIQFDERPGNSFMLKASLRLRQRWMIRSAIEKHYAQIIERAKGNQIDKVVVVSPEAITVRHLNALRAHCPKADFILYLWDSLANRPRAPELMPHFDRKVTFDLLNYKEGKFDEFLPLYYPVQYDLQKSENTVIKYDLCMIGTAHSDRYKIMQSLRLQAQQHQLSTFIHMFIHGRRVYLYNKLTNPSFSGSRFSDFSTHSLTHREVADIIQQSKAIIDINHPGQSGLTNRTLECLGSRRKLITTNPTVAQYNFFNPHNISIIDRCNPILSPGFLATQYVDANEEVRKQYSIDCWAESLLFGRKGANGYLV